jgi:hypothetical protein
MSIPANWISLVSTSGADVLAAARQTFKANAVVLSPRGLQETPMMVICLALLA